MCCCCNPETNWNDDFSGSYLDRCYWLHSFAKESGLFVHRYRRPTNTDILSGGEYEPASYVIDPAASPLDYRQYYLHRYFKFFKDVDFEIFFEVGVEDLNTDTRITFYLCAQYFQFQYEPNLYSMRGGSDGNSVRNMTGNPTPTSVTLGWRIQVLGTIGKWAMRYYVDGTEQTTWDTGPASGTQRTYSNYTSDRDTPSSQHASVWINKQISSLATNTKFSHFKLQSKLL